MNGLLRIVSVLAVMASVSFAYPQMDTGVIQRMSRNLSYRPDTPAIEPESPQPEVSNPEFSEPEPDTEISEPEVGQPDVAEPVMPIIRDPIAPREEPSAPTFVQMAAETPEEPLADKSFAAEEQPGEIKEIKTVASPEYPESPVPETFESEAAPIESAKPIESQDSEIILEHAEPISASHYAPIHASEPEQSPLASCSRAELKERVEAIMRQLSELKELCAE
ncbi:uncharacterized protein LOC129725432 [Wyeomyia smithii]|uniref:uncharacterized protein LOC129725432 n=1 Tax=Wyeomyia smithii TaxID=174621 RepID=UPI002467C117|nr:uncharacterized protein LOC129725432 [Wyeomyia smithii]